MGIIEFIIAGLCLNLTSCPGDSEFDLQKTSFKLQRYFELAAQLKDEQLIVTTLKNGDLSGVKTLNGSVIGSGVAFDLIQILQKKFGFTYTIVQPKENVFGTGAEGVYNLLLKDKANVAAAFLPIISSYRKDILYSPMLDTGEWVVLMKRPKESATGSGLLAPFTVPVWILIILSLLVVGPVIYLLILLQSRLCKNDRNVVFPLPACIWFVYGALLKQGTTLSPMTDSSRFLFSTWWIFITILTAFYTANLTAFLTLSKFTLPIEKPKDIGLKHYRWLSNKGNAIQDAMQEEERNYELDAQSRLVSSIGTSFAYPDTSDDDILAQYVVPKDMMFIRERPVVDYVMYEDYKQKTKAGIKEAERCTFVVTKWPVTTYSRAFAYSKTFKYYELFDSTIQHLVESGIIQFKLSEELPDTEICPLNLGNKERRLRNSDLIMTYLIVGGGLVIAALIFTVELILSRFKTARKPPEVLKVVQGKSKSFATPPPAYNTIFDPNHLLYGHPNYRKKMINGRQYWINGGKGVSEIIPMRTPSALLFQFTK